MKDLRQRKNIRLQEYDYSQPGHYFITICTKERIFLFGDIANYTMFFREYGKIAAVELINISSHYDNVKIDKFVIMPNHVHMIINLSEFTGVKNVGAPLAAPDDTDIDNKINNNVKNTTTEAGRASAPPTIGNIVRGYKSGVSRNIGFNIWQRNYHDHIIRNEKSYKEIYKYIENNPIQWELDCHNPENPKYHDWRDE